MRNPRIHPPDLRKIILHKHPKNILSRLPSLRLDNRLSLRQTTFTSPATDSFQIQFCLSLEVAPAKRIGAGENVFIVDFVGVFCGYRDIWKGSSDLGGPTCKLLERS